MEDLSGLLCARRAWLLLRASGVPALEGGDAGSNLSHLLEHIAPALRAPGESDANAVARRSARLNAERLTSESEILREASAEDGLRILTAYFHFTTGAVEFD